MEIQGLGFCGGLLVLSSRGRPVEFHCTSPVLANRAQQILYGQTLREFVCCDQIGVALVEKVKSNLDMILVDDRQFSMLADLLPHPVAVVSDTEETVGNVPQQTIGSRLEIAGQQFEVFGGRNDQTEQLLEHFVGHLPADEPFERIRAAISEAHAEAA